MPKQFLLLLLLSLPTVGITTERALTPYGPPGIHPDWSFLGEPQRCRLVQEIPRFGGAWFEQRQGQRLTFAIQTERVGAHIEQAELLSVPPVWRHHLPIRSLGPVTVGRGQQLLSLNAARSQGLLSELEAGMSPTLTYVDRTRKSTVLTALSPFGFQQPMRDFLSCTSSLTPYDFSQDDRHTIRFATASWALDNDQLALLDQLVEQLFSEQSISRIRVVGHTDGVGNHYNNRILSRQREQSVLNQLIARGVPREMIEAAHQGERQPIADNSSSAGRDLNRRVEIQLVRTEG